MAAIVDLGGISVVSSVDLADISHNINYCGPDPVSHEGITKFEGMQVIVDIGAAGTDYCYAVSMGDKSDSPWMYLDGTTPPVTPS